MGASPLFSFRIYYMTRRTLDMHRREMKYRQSSKIVLAAMAWYMDLYSKGKAPELKRVLKNRRGEIMRVQLPRSSVQTIDLVATKERQRYILEGPLPLVGLKQLDLEWALNGILEEYLKLLGWTEVRTNLAWAAYVKSLLIKKGSNGSKRSQCTTDE